MPSQNTASYCCQRYANQAHAFVNTDHNNTGLAAEVLGTEDEI